MLTLPCVSEENSRDYYYDDDGELLLSSKRAASIQLESNKKGKPKKIKPFLSN